MVGSLQIEVLGGFAAALGAEPLALNGRKTQALLAVLALAAGAPVPRDRLANLLWGDRGDEQARGSLRQALAELRKALGAEGAALLEAERDTVTLPAAGVNCDALELQQLSTGAEAGDLERAGAIYKGDLLDNIGIGDAAFEDWLQGERQRLRALYQEAMARLLAQQEAAGDATAAIDTGRKLLAFDPLQESVHRALMRLYMTSGDRTLALKQYQACCDVLQADLGVEPEAETKALYESLRVGDGEKRTDRPEPASEDVRSEAPTLPDKPAIAVLPFVNMSGDADQEYFADGITEDIITELSRFRSLLVIARNSSFHYKGQSAKVQDIGRALGVHYVVEGSVRKVGPRVRISAQLVEASTGQHLWAERYDRELEDIFAVQDEVVSEIVTAVPGHVDIASRAKAERKPAKDHNAYDLVLRAEAIFYKAWTTLEVQELLERALTLEPGYARAHARLASFLAYSIFSHSYDYEETSERARQHADSALEIDPNDPAVQAGAADAYILIGDHASARLHIEKAIALNPNDFSVMLFAGLNMSYLGEYEAGLHWTREAARRDPYVSDALRESFFDCYFLAGSYEEAIALIRGWRNPPPHIHAQMAAAYVMLGRLEEARAEAKLFKQLNPQGWDNAGIRRAHARMCAIPEDGERWLEGYRKAGIPV